LYCLIASSRSAWRRWLAKTAERWSWKTVVCEQPEDAQVLAGQFGVQLAFVDVANSQGTDFRELVTQLASSPKVLVVVCGNEADLAEETWARELGVWFYLPGICQTSSIDLLCRDARTISTKHAAVAAQANGSQEWNSSKVAHKS